MFLCVLLFLLLFFLFLLLCRVELKLGKRTETLDAEGKIIEEKEIPQNMLEQSNKSNIEKTLKTFEGEIEQKPPIYS